MDQHFVGRCRCRSRPRVRARGDRQPAQLAGRQLAEESLHQVQPRRGGRSEMKRMVRVRRTRRCVDRGVVGPHRGPIDVVCAGRRRPQNATGAADRFAVNAEPIPGSRFGAGVSNAEDTRACRKTEIADARLALIANVTLHLPGGSEEPSHQAQIHSAAEFAPATRPASREPPQESRQGTGRVPPPSLCPRTCT